MTGHSKFPILYINLARRPDRRERLEATLSRGNFAVTRIEAVDGLALGEDAKGQFLPPGEIACWKSHQAAYRHMVENNIEYALVLEDDAAIAPETVNQELLLALCKYMGEHKIKLLQLGYLSAHYPIWRVGLLAAALTDLRGGKFKLVRLPSGKRRLIVLNSFRSGSHAFILSIEAARLLRNLNDPPTFPVDRYFQYLADFGKSRLKIARMRGSMVNQWSRDSLREDNLDSDIASQMQESE